MQLPDLPPLSLTLVHVLTLMTPVFLAFILLEYLYFRKKRRVRKIYSGQDSLTSVELSVLYQVGEVAGGIALSGVYLFLYQHRFWTIPTTFGTMVGLFFLQDFLYYWFHRSAHMCRVMWASHIAHHSSQRMNFTVAFRQSLTYNLSGMFLFWLPLPLIGFDPVAVLTMVGLSLGYQFFLHTEWVKKLGPLEWVFNTPSHHRVHHNRDPQYMNRNFGGILIVWDHLFGTFRQEADERENEYGIPTLIPSSDPLVITFYEWFHMGKDALQARSLKQRFLHVFGEPNWQYPGTELHPLGETVPQAQPGDAPTLAPGDNG